MAKNTSSDLKNKVIYSIYLRNHCKEGTFNAASKDLRRIKNLGVDIIWLLPIHPIGQVNKKGDLGCPYSIEDYRKVNPDYGTLEDFKNFLKEAHSLNMKVIIDVVYNHTSHNSQLFTENPQWFFRKENGSTGNKVGDWTDIIDLDYNNKELWQYQIETLKYWTNIGVDGFRCDVAPLIPVEFWLEARKEVGKINNDTLWLAETVDPNFIRELRKNNVPVHSDCEMYSAFDITYDYDTYDYTNKYWHGAITLEDLLDKKRIQEIIYPHNYVKMRFIENHDHDRAANILSNDTILKNWTAFMFFEKGATLINAGQEVKDTNTPSLFYKDLVNWNYEPKFTNFIKKLVQIKKDPLFSTGYYEILESNNKGVVESRYYDDSSTLVGIFNLEGKIGKYATDLRDGIYTNLIDNSKIFIENGSFSLINNPIILKVKIDK